MGAYTPSEAVAALRDKAAGQDIFLAVVTGPNAEHRERLAINRFDRCSTIDCGPTLVSAGTVTAVCSNMTGELAQTLTGIASDFGDELYSKGLLQTDVPIQATFPMATVEAFQNKQLHIGKTHFEDGYEIHCLPGYVFAVEMLLKRLGKQPIRQNELASNPTYEQQTSKKSTCRKQNKADKWLKILEQDAKREITGQLRESGYDPTQKEIEAKVTKEIRSKGRFDLAELVASLPPYNGEEPPQKLSIKEGRSSVYDSWKQHRSTPGRKRSKGDVTKKAADADGLAVRREGEGFQERSTDSVAADALTSFYDELLKDPASVDGPAALQEFKILLARQGPTLDAEKELERFSTFLTELKAEHKNVGIWKNGKSTMIRSDA